MEDWYSVLNFESHYNGVRISLYKANDGVNEKLSRTTSGCMESAEPHSTLVTLEEYM